MGVKIYNNGFGNLPSFTFYVGTPNETTLVFSEAEWRYYRLMPDGSRVAQDGVTTVLHKTCDRSKPLMAWACKRALAKLKRILTERGYVTPVDSETVQPLFEKILDDIIKLARTAPDDELLDAGAVGTKAHSWVQSYIQSVIDGKTERTYELLAKLPIEPRACNCVIAALDFMYRHSIVWLSTERKCFSLKHGVAGTCDGICLASSCGDPDCCPADYVDRKTLCDWKSANGLYCTFLMQAAIYQEMYTEETGEKIEQRFIVRLGKDDGEFESWHAEGDELFHEDRDGFLNALALYRSLHKIETRISDNKEVRRQKRKELLATERAVRCLDADKYKGVRKKKGCNGTDIMCETCTSKYQEHNGSSETLGGN